MVRLPAYSSAMEDEPIVITESQKKPMEHIEEVDQATSSEIRTQLYRVLEEYIEKTKRRPRSFSDILNRVIYYLREKNMIMADGVDREVERFIQREFLELFLQRIIVPAPFGAQVGNEKVPIFDFTFFVITPYGMKVMEDFPNRIQTHDPTGYLNNFSNALPAPDQEFMRYLSEAVLTFRDGHLLACVVLLSTANDYFLNIIAKNVKRVKGGDWYEQTYKPNSQLKDRFARLTHKLSSDFSPQMEANNLSDSLNTVVPAVFHLIRTARNDIAHPNGRVFGRNEVNGLLHSFVGYYLCLNQIIGILAAEPPAP